MFSERELQTLTLICDTLIPALDIEPDEHIFYRRKASDLNVATQVAEALDYLNDPDLIRQLRLFLAALETPLANLVLSQQGGSFSAMDLQDRTMLLRTWENSFFNFRRKAFHSLKRLAMMMFYSADAMWPAIGYSGPPPGHIPERPLTTIVPQEITTDTVLHTDVVVVGSGAGGGVIAGELSAAGLDVIVLEKGDFFPETALTGNELDSTERLFENKGLLTTRDLAMTILAGSTLGGGTTVNWMASLRTPDYVLHEWDTEYGVSAFRDAVYQDALDAVSQRIHVTRDYAQDSRQNHFLELGAQTLGMQAETVPRNIFGCGGDCGFCNYGCPYGAKQSTMRTYLQDAFDRGSRIFVRAHVDRVIVHQGRAVGVEATITDQEGETHKVTVQARAVVIAAGALHTPAILLRSGLSNMHIGRNLHMHPTTATYGIFPEPVKGWSGPIMSRYVDDFMNLDGLGYGVVLETAPIHPGIAALTLPWANGYQHKNIMSRLAHLSNIITVTRDYDGGRITLNRRGSPVVHYTLGDEDAQHMMRGVLESLRILRAAGAEQVGAPFALPLTWHRDGEQDFDTYLRSVSETHLRPNAYALFSAHQMSSCRMAGSPALGAVAPDGQTYEVANLYVADGSVLPSASGVNPMLTIMATAHVIASHIRSVLA